MHYIGEADLDGTLAALRTLSAEAVPLVVEGVGHFRTRDGAIALWAGVKADPRLTALHAALAAALAPTGFRPEARPWSPHISLARCEPAAPPALAEAFLKENASLRHVGSKIDAVGLYSSVFVEGAPRYTCEATFPLL